MALINTFSWKYCQLDVVVRRCSDSVSDHLGHVKVDICDLSRCTWKRSNGTACTVAYPPHLHGPVRISGNFVPDHFHPWTTQVSTIVRVIFGKEHAIWLIPRTTALRNLTDGTCVTRSDVNKQHGGTYTRASTHNRCP